MSTEQQPTNGQYQDQPIEQPVKRPEQVLRDGALKASIWRNDSKNGPFFSTDFAKTYEDRNGNLQDSRSFSGTDLLRLSELARHAYTVTNDLRRQAAQQQTQGQTPTNTQAQAQTAPQDRDSRRADYMDKRTAQPAPSPAPSQNP